MGNNGYFAPMREVSEGSHDVTMAETVSSDVSMTDADGTMAQGDAQDTVATLDESGATSSQPHHRRQLVYRALRRQHRGQSLERKHRQGFSLPSKTSSRMSSTRHQARSGLLSRISLSSFRTKKRHSLQHGSTQQTATAMTCGLTWSMPGRRVTVQEREFISRSIQ